MADSWVSAHWVEVRPGSWSGRVPIRNGVVTVPLTASVIWCDPTPSSRAWWITGSALTGCSLSPVLQAAFPGATIKAAILEPGTTAFSVLPGPPDPPGTITCSPP